MNPDPTQQVFALLVGVAAAGIVAATLTESGVLRAPEDGAEVAAIEAPTAPTSPDGVPDELLDPVPDEVADPSLAVPSEPIPTGDGSADTGAVEGSGAAVDAAAAAAAGGEAADDDAPDGAWEPLRRAADGTPCLVRANRALIANGINRREPTGTEGPFRANGEPIIAFFDMANGTGVSQPVTVVWTRDEDGASFLDTIDAGPGSRWRTWVERPFALDRIGAWTVQLLDDERCLIDEVSFDLVAPEW